MKLKMAGLVCVSFVLILTLLGGCGAPASTVEPVTKAAPTAKAPEKPAKVEPAVPELKSNSGTYKFKNSAGYTNSLALTIWEPVPAADFVGSFEHPADASFTLAKGANYAPKRDLAIPASIQTKNTTSKFDVGMRFQIDLMQDTNLSVSPLDGAKLVEIMSSNGVGELKWLVENHMNGEEQYYVGNADADRYPIEFTKVPSGGIGNMFCFIIIHDYYTPSTTEGAKEMLNNLVLRLNEVGLGDLEAEKDSTNFFGLTLSGRSVSSLPY